VLSLLSVVSRLILYHIELFLYPFVPIVLVLPVLLSVSCIVIARRSELTDCTPGVSFDNFGAIEVGKMLVQSMGVRAFLLSVKV
jgi:hypothetical protein